MLQEALHEVNKPLARSRNDADLDAHLRQQDREGDPMLAFIKKKKAKTNKSGKVLLLYFSGSELASLDKLANCLYEDGANQGV